MENSFQNENYPSTIFRRNVEQDVYYTDGHTNTEPLRDIANASRLPSDPLFCYSFRHFLLFFTLDGENIYKEKIRKLDLNPLNSSSSSNQTSRCMPSVSVDLEHLIMPHWTSNTEIATLASDKEDVDSLDEQRDEDFMSNRKDWGGMLVFALRQQPLHFLKLAEQCVREVYLELFGFDTRSGSALSVAQQCEPLSLFQVELISRQRPTRIGDLAATDVETLVTVPGIVVQASRPQHKALKVKIKCRQCEHEQFLYIPLWRETVEFPRVCGAKGGRSGNPAEPRCPLDPYIIVSDESEFCDIQTIKIQELPEQVFGGDMPHHVTVHAANALCGRVAPGHRILVAGVYSIQHKSNSLAQNINDESVQTAYLYALGISRMDATTRSLTKSMMKGSNPWTFQQEEEFQKMARNTTIHQQIFDSIAPSIFGLEDIKKSIACLLFGGSMKKLPDGSRLRGDINILLLGDPSTAKSQFLKFVERVAPIAVYTSGKGSSAAGLTAAVIRDSNRNFALEGGAMVLADGGVVCIDEFDKMRDDDRVAIHEAMEQQTISIAKAGITTVLTTRCSVLAAANPSFGSYDDFKETIEQHNFETTILSRFDLIWLVRDIKNAQRDEKIARHVIELHSGSARTVQADGPIPWIKLRSYIAYCRAMCSPVLSEDAAKVIENFYVEVRENIRKNPHGNKRDEIPITVRQLESLCRIAESLAKMSLSRMVTTEHVHHAIQLFKLSTLEAAKGGLNREYMTEAERDRVKSAEAIILQKLPIGGKASKSSILRDLKLRGYDTFHIGKTLSLLIQKGILEERGDATVKRIAIGQRTV